MARQQSPHRVEVFRLLGKFWTIANLLSMMRLILVVPITYLILTDGPLTWVLGLIAIALMTDWFDGRVARWSRTVSEWGKVLDPLADKVAGACVVLALTVRESLPLWFLGVIVLRDLLIVLGGVVLARSTGQVVMSVWMGKVAVTALAVTALAALMGADPPVMQFCVWVTTGLLVYSFMLYVGRFLRMMRIAKRADRPQSEGDADRVGSMRQEAGSVG